MDCRSWEDTRSNKTQFLASEVVGRRYDVEVRSPQWQRKEGGLDAALGGDDTSPPVTQVGVCTTTMGYRPRKEERVTGMFLGVNGSPAPVPRSRKDPVAL